MTQLRNMHYDRSTYAQSCVSTSVQIWNTLNKQRKYEFIRVSTGGCGHLGLSVNTDKIRNTR